MRRLRSVLAAAALLTAACTAHAGNTEPQACLAADPNQWPAAAKPYFLVIADSSASMSTSVGTSSSCGSFGSSRHAHARCALARTYQSFDGLVQFARPHIYTTAMPPALAAAARVAVDIARFESWRRERLQALVRHLRQGARQRGLELLPSRTAIQPLRVGDSLRALALSQALEAQGYYVPAIRPPTVAAGKARLRITVSALHTEAQVEALLDALVQAQA